VTAPLVLAVDGGNFKTDLALVRADGEALALVRGPQSSPHHLVVDGCVHVLEDLLASAVREAGIPNGHGPVAEIAQLLLAGVDFPVEEEEVRAAVDKRGLATKISVGNDTFAVLRAGTERGWGVAIVCGAGINCVGVAPDGRHARFPALGAITGDWGGGYDVGLAAVSAAARSEDGRGPKTSLERAVPAHFGLETPSSLAEEIHRGRISISRVTELAPTVLAEARSDAVALGIITRLADEIVTLTRVAVERLDLADEHIEVLLGGGLIRADDGTLVAAVAEGMREVAPNASVHATSSPPIVGAALLGLDSLGADAEAQQRLRRELGAAFANIENGRKTGG
jgi:N-acetylglucosamine kinase-like BadF-type ATPase